MKCWKMFERCKMYVAKSYKAISEITTFINRQKSKGLLIQRKRYNFQITAFIVNEADLR